MYARGWDRPNRRFPFPSQFSPRPERSWVHSNDDLEKEEMIAAMEDEDWRWNKQRCMSQQWQWQGEPWTDQSHYSPRCSPENSEMYENHWRDSHMEQKPRGPEFWRFEPERTFDYHVDNMEDEDSRFCRRRVQPVPPLRCKEWEMPRSPTQSPRNQQSVHPPFVTDRAVKRFPFRPMPEMELSEHSAQMAVDEMPSYPYHERGLTNVNKNLKRSSPHLTENEVKRGNSHDSDKEPGSQPAKTHKKSSEPDQAMESKVKRPETNDKVRGVPVTASGGKTPVESPGHDGTYPTRSNFLELYDDTNQERKLSSGIPKSISPRLNPQILSKDTCVQERSPKATAWRAPLGPDCGKEEDNMKVKKKETELNKDDAMKQNLMQTAKEAQPLDNMMESACVVEFDEACENRMDGYDKRNQAVIAKKLEIEQAFKQDCRTVVSVVKMLVRSAPELEGMVGPALRGSLKHLSQRCLQQMQEFVSNFNSNNSQANV